MRAPRVQEVGRPTQRAPRATATSHDSIEAIYTTAKKAAAKTLRLTPAKQGQPFLIGLKDVVLPSYCPLLKRRLKYRGRSSQGSRVSNHPTLIRLIPEAGWIPHNVLVVSARAATLLKLATADELIQIGATLKKYLDAVTGRYVEMG